MKATNHTETETIKVTESHQKSKIMTTMNTMNTITSNATLFDGGGYIIANRMTITDHGDAVTIGVTSHNKEDLIIGPKNITSRIADPTWELVWQN